MKSPTLVLLAGGSSSRFSPLHEKNLFKFLGETLIERQIKFFMDKGFDEIVLVAGENNFKQIKEEVQDKSLDVKVLIQKGEGQAGAVITALKEIDLEKSVLIVNMNDVFDESLYVKFRKFLEHNADQNALVGYKVDRYFPGGYLVLDGENVKDVVEKPGQGNEPSQFVRIVFDYFNSARRLFEALKTAESASDDVYEVALSSMMQDSQQFEMIEHDGAWETIKYPWHVLSMMRYFLDRIESPSISDKAEIADSAVIKGNVIIEDGVKVFDGAVINGPAYIGKNSIVANGALVRDSQIGENCVVGFATEIARSYISDNCWFHTNYVGDSVLGENVSLGSGAVTANLRLDEQEISVNIKGEKINSGLTKLGNIIGSNVRIGVNTTLLPGIKIGSGSLVGSAVLVDEDIEGGKFVYIKQEKQIKENRFDITKTSRDEIKKGLK